MADSTRNKPTDEDVSKGAVETDPLHEDGRKSQVSIEGQIGHRDQDPMLKDSDTDFPEPDAVEEHSGEEGS